MYYQAIVLSVDYTASDRYYLFDQKKGVVRVSINGLKNYYGSLSTGSLVSYTLISSRFISKISLLSCDAVPALWVCDNLDFFHHVLEVLRYFSNETHNHMVIYDHIAIFFDESNQWLAQKEMQYVYLVKLFFLLGIYPEESEHYEKNIFNLISSDKLSMLNEQGRFFCTKKVSNWLSACLKTHPKVHTMKTKFFLLTE